MTSDGENWESEGEDRRRIMRMRKGMGMGLRMRIDLHDFVMRCRRGWCAEEKSVQSEVQSSKVCGCCVVQCRAVSQSVGHDELDVCVYVRVRVRAWVSVSSSPIIISFIVPVRSKFSLRCRAWCWRF